MMIHSLCGHSSWCLPLFKDIARKALKVQLYCAETMDRTRATTRLVPKDRQRAYAMRALGLEDGTDNAAEALVDLLP